MDGFFDDGGDRVASLMYRAEALLQTDTCGTAHRRFRDDEDLLALAVVDERSHPVGLINRQHLFVRLADQFGWALFERKPITALMDPDPFVVDKRVSFDKLSELIVAERPSALMSGFVITDAGQYEGVGTALSVLQMSVERSSMRAAALERARAQAIEANDAKSRFLANISHELRTPLNAIIGFSDIMKQQTFGALGNDRYRDYAVDINSSGVHLLQLINDILDLSKIEAGKLEPVLDAFDIEVLLGSCFRMFERMAAQSACALELETAHDGALVMADEKMVRQVLLNLISNALKFTNAGGTVLVRISSGAEVTEVAVIDNGIGMNPEDIPGVIEPFRQLDNGLNRKYQGSGLGLPISRALVLAQGGEFSIESEQGVGTSVVFTLPRAKSSESGLSSAM